MKPWNEVRHLVGAALRRGSWAAATLSILVLLTWVAPWGALMLGLAAWLLFQLLAVVVESLVIN